MYRPTHRTTPGIFPQPPFPQPLRALLRMMLASLPAALLLPSALLAAGPLASALSTAGPLPSALSTAEPLPSATSFQGSWQRTIQEGGEAVHEVLLFTDQYFSWTAYRADDNAFIMTKGGSWSRAGDAITVTYEFHTADSTRVGSSETMDLRLDAGGSELRLPADAATPWTDHVAAQAELHGAWLFAGRKRDGEITRRDTDRSRKTMKILTGGWFQWIAYDTANGRFSGSGGGAYTAEDGKYVEHIKFFSRDKTRVGAELPFDYALQDGEWHHSGLNSRGEPMYEIWAPRD